MTSHSPLETKKIAEEFIKRLTSHPKNSGATVLGLYGDLGSGKTTFTQHLASTLGIGDHVVSPTFIIMKRYELKNKNWKFLYHIDAYRLENVSAVYNLGWNDLIKDPENLIIVEWPERISEAMPTHSLKINFTWIDDTTRRIEF